MFGSPSVHGGVGRHGPRRGEADVQAGRCLLVRPLWWWGHVGAVGIGARGRSTCNGWRPGVGLWAVQLGGDAGDGRQLRRIGRYGRAGHVAGIVDEAWGGEVLGALGALRRPWQRVGGGTGRGQGLGRRQTRGSALCMARSQIREHVGGRHRGLGGGMGAVGNGRAVSACCL